MNYRCRKLFSWAAGFLFAATCSASITFSASAISEVAYTPEANVKAATADTLDRIVTLREVVVKPSREHYSKKNNPAVDFMEMLRSARSLSDPTSEPQYNYRKYERIVLALNNVEDSIGNMKGVLAKLPMLRNHVDTSEITGHTILPISVKEKVADIYHRSNPTKKREYVIGIKREGLDDIANMESTQIYLEDMLRDIDLYENDVTLLSNRFVSPLSKIGADFYRYYLTDTVALGPDTCAILSFAPRNTAQFGFVGRFYVPLNSERKYVKRATMTLSHNANVNFVKSLLLTQEFELDSLGNRLKKIDDLAIEFLVVPGAPEAYVRKYTTYANHNYDDADRPELFGRLGDSYVASDAYIRDDNFWDSNRDHTYHRSHRQMGNLVAGLRSMPLYYWTEQVIKVLVAGYIPLGNKDKVELGPVNTMVSFNDVEKVRFRLGGLTTANLSPHWFFRGYAAYGLRDKKLLYSAEAEYSFNKKRRHSREFPVRSIRARYSYDLDAIGQDYAFTNPDNIFISLKRMSDTLMVYKRDMMLEYKYEFDNHVSASLTLDRVRQEASRYIHFNFADGSHARHLDFSTAKVSFRYAPGEKFLQTKSERIPVNIDALVFQITHTYGAPNFMGSSPFTLNKTEVDLRKRFWFSAFGYLDVIAKGGHVWSAVPFTELLVPNANLTYTVQPETFALLNPMEFVTDTYGSLDLTYWANGAIFNYIPLIKKLRWREAFEFRAFWGDLSDKNNPACNPALPLFPVGTNPVNIKSTPYMEFAVGIDNIFRILRLDYTWRLTYRNTPGVSKSGLRIALHFTF